MTHMPHTLMITIPRTLVRKGDLVVIPRREYEALRALKNIREFAPSPAQKKALVRAERHLRQGKALSYDELVSGLGITH